MKQFRKHSIKKWEISVIEIESLNGKKYKVTRSLPELLIAETKNFKSKEKARQKFNEWLQ